MNKEELYNNKDAFTEIINWPGIANLVGSLSIVPTFFRPFNGVCHMPDNDSKNKITYSYLLDEEGKVDHSSSKCKRLVLQSSDGRKLTIEYASLIDLDSIALTYELKNNSIKYKISLKGQDRFNMRNLSLKDIDSVKIMYGELELFTYYTNITHLYEIIIDELYYSVFSDDELKMFDDNIYPIIHLERCNELKSINNILRRMGR